MACVTRPSPASGRRPRAPGLALALAALQLLAPAAEAQTPRPGEWFRDTAELGFELRLPKGWDFVPPEPGEPNLMGRADAGPAQQILAPGSERSYGWHYQVWIVKLDRRPGPRVGADGRPARTPAPDLDTWLKQSPPSGGPRGWREDPAARSEGALGELQVTEREFTQTIGEQDTEVRLYAQVAALGPEVDLAVVYNGPGGKKWSKHRAAARALARTLERVPLEEPPAGADTPGTDTVDARAAARARLERELARSAGWRLHETESYLVVTGSDDEAFVAEALERLEAIRAVFERHLPVEPQALESDADGGGAVPAGAPGAGAAAPTAAPGVVRICATREQYRAYGGPAGTGGYWSDEAGELVLYDDREVLGRDATWAALNHEAYHQYLHGRFGPLDPHTWYEEGHGDWFGGFDYEHGRFVETPNAERLRDARALLRSGREVPLRELVRWPKSRYYGQGPNGTGPAEHYAEGWSLVHFLRTGSGRAPGWDAAWDGILDTYLEVLVTERDARRAVEAAFAEVDWEAFERAWRAYTLD